MLTAQQINFIQLASTANQLYSLAPEQDWGCTISFLNKHLTRVPSDLHMQDNYVSAFGWLWYTLSSSKDGDAIYYPSRPMDYSNDFRFSFSQGFFTQEELDLNMAKLRCRPHGKAPMYGKPRVNHECSITTLPPDGDGIVKYMIKSKCGKVAFVGRCTLAMKYMERAQKWAQKGGRPV